MPRKETPNILYLFFTLEQEFVKILKHVCIHVKNVYWMQYGQQINY